VPKDNFAEAEKYNKQYHSYEKIEDKICSLLLDSTFALGDDNNRAITVSELINFIGLTHVLMGMYSKRVETRCVINEYLLEDTWDMLKNIAKRVHTKADMDKLSVMEQRVASMRKEDSNLNEKFDRIEPMLESFEQFLADRGLKPEDLFHQKHTNAK